MARKILLADDSVTAQNMGRKILADAGYEVITVNNGSAALKRIADAKPDVIVLDVYMPGYSGLEVCQRLKESNDTARIPILLTVGKLEPFKPEEARRVRAEGFIVKPFEASELLSALTKLEDKIVPRADSSKPGRFARAIAAVEEGRFDKTVAIDEDSGWRSRISFPPKKKEKPPEPEDQEDPSIYNPVNRDLKTVIEHKPAHEPHSAPATEMPVQSASQAPLQKEENHVDLGALVAHGLPKDVTPEEIAALAAAAAQVQGIAQGSNDDAVSTTQVSATEIPQQEPKKSEEASSSLPESTPARVEETKAEPVKSETATESAGTETDKTELEKKGLEAAASSVVAQASETPVVAPSAALTESTPISEKKEFAIESVASSERASSERGATFAPQSSAGQEATAAETKVAEVAEEKTDSSAPSAEPTVASFATNDSATALGNSTSAPVSASTAEPGPVTMAVAAAQSAGPSRWSAVAVALAPEEASTSLEEEMRRAQAAIASVPQPEAVSAESQAVEKPAEVAEIAPVAEGEVTQPEAPAVAASASPVSVKEETQPETAAATPVVKEFETVTPREPEALPVVPEATVESPAALTATPTEAAELPREVSEVVERAPEVQQPDPSAESDAAEFASLPAEDKQSEIAPVVQQESISEAVVSDAERDSETDKQPEIEAQPAETIAQQPENLISQRNVEPAAIAATEQISGGSSDMAKKESEIAETTAAAWASWRRIRDTGDSKSTGATKESEIGESPRDEAAMAVAAGAEKAPEEISDDAELSPEIASIVDSVLADLRPKIVEEISRKLGKKK